MARPCIRSWPPVGGLSWPPVSGVPGPAASVHPAVPPATASRLGTARGWPGSGARLRGPQLAVVPAGVAVVAAAAMWAVGTVIGAPPPARSTVGRDVATVLTRQI